MKDLIIVGGGPAAMSAGVYAARRSLDILVIAEDLGGYVKETDKIENYLGFESIAGIELSEKFEEHLSSYDVEILEEAVDKVYEKDSKVVVELENGKKFESKVVIVCTGSRRRELKVTGEKKFMKKGVTYCAICDGPLFNNQEVAVVGGGYAGVHSALYLSKIAKKVYILEVEDELMGEEVMNERVRNTKNISVLTNVKINEIFGGDEVEGLKYVDLKDNASKELKVSGVFIEVGSEPNSSIVDVDKDKRGYIKVDKNMRTSSDRIFAAGDVNDSGSKQIAVAVGQGCIAALESDKIISSK